MTVIASITVDGIAALKPKQIRDAGRIAIKAVGDRWIKDYLPRHFLQSATSRYGYTRRAERYRVLKRRGGEINDVASIKEDRPLVWSGRSRERARMARTEAKATSSTSAHADVVIDAPALNFVYAGSAMNLREEVTAILPQEVEVLAALFVRMFERELDRMGKTTRRLLRAA